MIALGTVLGTVALGALFWWGLGTLIDSLETRDRAKRRAAYEARKRGQ